ncbi:hypothetical protein O6H91_20G044700 [Diphasiastrum complanatum]|uniref:Uncharacterized protein n=1 Tax=Diphasiastrum complanatum TaxID=34168 RepID=A0ACC2APV0_DIPCM|nr:hypothetical protein O6H91_20G044700 [Diphasiastrum complanatum]
MWNLLFLSLCELQSTLSLSSSLERSVFVNYWHAGTSYSCLVSVGCEVKFALSLSRTICFRRLLACRNRARCIQLFLKQTSEQGIVKPALQCATIAWINKKRDGASAERLEHACEGRLSVFLRSALRYIKQHAEAEEQTQFAGQAGAVPSLISFRIVFAINLCSQAYYLLFDILWKVFSSLFRFVILLLASLSCTGFPQAPR